MNKPFDFAALVEALKAKGLPMTEVLAETAVAEMLAWVEASAAIHPNIIVKTAVPLAVATIKPILANELNKIDGLEG